jgi:hypothetical protein
LIVLAVIGAGRLVRRSGASHALAQTGSFGVEMPVSKVGENSYFGFADFRVTGRHDVRLMGRIF